MAVGSELLDAIVAPIGNIYIAIGVNGDPPGHAEVTGATAGLAPFEEEFAIFGELLNAAVQAVHDVEVIVLIEGYPRWAIELSIPSSRCPPLAYPIAILGEDRNAVIPLIGHVDVAGFVEGDGSRPHEATIRSLGLGLLSANAAAKFRDIVLAHGADGYSLAVWPPFIGATEHIEPVACPTGYPHRDAKPWS